MEKQDFEALVQLTDKLDSEGMTEEASALDTVLTKIASTVKEAADDYQMSGKATNACQSLLRTLVSFCGKNLDARGEKRRQINKICDTAEDLRDDLKDLLGEK